ncbi:hypothetical protein [Sporosarcina sp. FSL K6-5500]|uniref:hypothetical protein n=1 Tax=Sporosarcina sp. FSL K6-5500 TaxID=2921558 RepID=UPI0030FAB9BA
MYLNLVTNLDQIKQNLKQYNHELQNGEMTLRTNGVQQWYYMMELDLFGPSRYIGYEGVTIHKHSQAFELHGGKTTSALNKWFQLCDDPELLLKITDKLLDHLSQLDMDVRRNKEEQPVFKLNLLKEDIPKLKKLYLTEKIIVDDSSCHTCHKPFYKEPFFAHNDRGPFCSRKCLPIDMHGEYKAIDYVTYVEKYREFVELYNEIENIDGQRDLHNELDIIKISMEEYVEQEPESDYILFIQRLNVKFIELQRNTHDFYIDETHLDRQKAIHINWATFGDDEFIEEQLTHLIDYLHEQLSDQSVEYKLLGCSKLLVDFATTNTVYFTSGDVSLETDNILEKVYTHVHEFLDDYDLGYDISAYIQNSLVAVCPKCGSYELIDHFSKDEEDIFCCQHC